MSFHVRIAFSNVHKEVARSVIAIGDTVLINEKGEAQVFTDGIQKKYSEISYSLDDSEEEAPKEK